MIVDTNIGGYLSKSANSVNSSTAETEVSGAYVDLTNKTNYPSGPPLSCRLVIGYTAVLVPSGTLTAAANLQDAASTDGTSVADFGSAFASTTVETNASTTADATVTGVVELDVNLRGAKPAVRSQQTLAASGTGVVTWSAALVFGPSSQQPPS